MTLNEAAAKVRNQTDPTEHKRILEEMQRSGEIARLLGDLAETSRKTREEPNYTPRDATEMILSFCCTCIAIGKTWAEAR